jgi:hypothetical protein
LKSGLRGLLDRETSPTVPLGCGSSNRISLMLLYFTSRLSSGSSERQLAEFKEVHPDQEADLCMAWDKVKADGGYKPNATPISDATPQITRGDAVVRQTWTTAVQ